ncbi:helix-turn-helix transcriptional regulator [bacterium]|nr:helix-turn-helix transcriptional regulator [bacterium]
MAKYTEPTTVVGSRIMDFRKRSKLTQADLANRYGISGPAVFKFEKGFVIPSLKLWQKMAADMDIPEKEAILLWVREKLPVRMQNLVRETAPLDIEGLRKQLEVASNGAKGAKSSEAMRQAILDCPEITPSLKSFVNAKEIWDILKPTLKEIIFLIEIDQPVRRLSVDQFRDLMILAREIQNPGKE